MANYSKFTKTIEKPMVFQYFQGFELLKFIKKWMKNRCKFGSGKYKPKNWSKPGLGGILGSIWEGFGTLWGLFWTLLGAFGSFLWHSKPNFCKALVQNGLQEAFGIDFGSILGGFGSLQGLILEGSRRFGDAFGMTESAL